MKNEQNTSQELQKKKKFKEIMRKIVINFFVWLVIITFVISLGTYYWNQQQVNVIRIAQINGKMYTYQPGSLFYHLMGLVRDTASKNLDKNADPDSLNETVVYGSIDFLTNYAMASDFSKKVGILAAPEMLKNILEYRLKGRLASVPDQGLLDFAEFEYANYSLTGDFNNILTVVPPTSGELYSYLDLANFSAEADVLYLNVSNYIIGKIRDSDIEKFYDDNISKYATEVIVDELSLKSKAVAYEILRTALTNGWDKAVAGFRDKAVLKSGLVLSRTNNMLKRFDVAITHKKGDVAQKVQFENSEYHIMRIAGYPPLSSRKGVNRDMVKADYVAKNFTALRKQFDQDLQVTVKKAEALVKSGSDFGTAAVSSGFSYARTGKTTAINDRLKDTKGNAIPVNYLKNPEWMDFLFTAKKAEVSKTFTDENDIVILKLITSGMNKKFSVQDINQDLLEQYLRFKAASSYQDWSRNLKKNYQIIVYKDDLTNLTEKNR